MAKTHTNRKDVHPLSKKNVRTFWQDLNLVTAQQMLRQSKDDFNLADTKTAGINRNGNWLRRFK